MIRKQTAALAAVLLVVLLMAAPQAAVAASAATVDIPVRVETTGPAPEAAEAFTVLLVPKTADCPMPAEGGSLSVKAGEEKSFRLSSDGPGVYEYTVRQKSGTSDACDYDTTEYQLTLYVTNASDGGLRCAVVSRDGAGEKPTDLCFTNKYHAADTPGPEKPDPVEDTPEPEKPDPVKDTPEPEKPDPVEDPPEPEKPDPVEDTPEPEKPEPTGGTPREQSHAGPKTGDDSQPVVWAAGLLACAAGVVCLTAGRRGKAQKPRR